VFNDIDLIYDTQEEKVRYKSLCVTHVKLVLLTIPVTGRYMRF